MVKRDGRLMAEVVRSEACQACRACNFGQQERVYIDIGSLKCCEGDIVTVEIDEGRVSIASVMAYGVPVIALFGGLFIGAFVSESDIVRALCAVAGLVVGLVAVRIMDKKLKAKGSFTPRVSLMCDEEKY